MPKVTDRPDDGRAVGAIPELTPDDDRFHPASDHWWKTETAWFSFSIPERRIGGWFYNQVLVDGVASDELSTGYLLRDGEYGHLVSGRRRTWLDPTNRWLRRVELEALTGRWAPG
ncbi:MAG TPA: hypothetical protein VFI47_09565 [Acidimicrobiales bacterium]|nr:hypothetical protein [Acidimicrobiales bacterium]